MVALIGAIAAVLVLGPYIACWIHNYRRYR